MREELTLSGWKFTFLTGEEQANSQKERPLPESHIILPIPAKAVQVSLTLDMFMKPEWQGKRLFLMSKGSNVTFSVSVNQMAAGYCGGISTSHVELTDAISFEGANQITLLASLPSDQSYFTVEQLGWLVCENCAVLPFGISYYTTIDENGKHILHVFTEIENDGSITSRFRLVHTLYDDQGKKRHAAGGMLTISPFSMYLDEREMALKESDAWRPENPKLYRLVTELQVKDTILETHETWVGLHQITTDTKQGVLLDGTPFPLKGLSESPIRLTRPTPDALLVQEAKHLVATGINVVYLPYDKNTEKRLCHFDRHGIFAVVEVPKKGTNRQSVGALRHAVRQLRAHPSLLMWSIGDVAVSLDAIRAERIALRLRHEVALLDFAHPVMGEVNALTSPTIVKALDLLLTQGGKVNAELVKSNHSQRPIWVASQAEDEFLVAFHLGEKSRYAGHLQIVEQTISPCESAIFRLMMAHPRLWMKLKACYCQKDPVLALQLPEQDATDAHTSLLLLSNCENVCMWVDGRPYGDMSKLNSPDKVLSIPSEFGYVEAVGFRRGKEVARFEYEPVGRAYALSLSPFFMPPSLKEGDVMWVVCQVLDGEGKSVEQAEGEVSFTLTGGAVFDAEPTLCEGEPFVLKLSGGRAALSLRKTERSASITLHAQSTAYVPTSLRLK